MAAATPSTPSISPARVRRVAVIGSGLAGLTTAYLLSHPETANGRFEVTLYESAPTYGMSAGDLEVPCGCQRCAATTALKSTPATTTTAEPDHVQERIDSPLRLFSEGYYPTLLQLYRHLQVPIAPVNFTFSLSTLTDKGAIDPATIVTTDIVRLTASLSLLLPTALIRPWSQRNMFILMRDKLRMSCAAAHLRATRQLHTVRGTLREYVAQHGYSRAYVDDLLVPTLAVAMSATRDQVLDMPARSVLDWNARIPVRNTALTVPCGVAAVCERLTRFLSAEQKRFGETVRGVRYHRASATYEVESARDTQTYDLVVLATPAHITARLVADCGAPHAADLASVLAHFGYDPVRVVVHTDTNAVLPADVAHVRGVVVSSNSTETMATIHVNALRGLPAHCPVLLQTTNPLVPINPKSVRGEWTFPRVRLTPAAESALDAVPKLQGLNGLFVVGSPMYPGIPLLEGCVGSAVDVAGRLGVQRPWQVKPGEYVGFDPDRKEPWVDAFYAGDLAVKEPAPWSWVRAVVRSSAVAAVAAVAAHRAGWTASDVAEWTGSLVAAWTTAVMARWA
ncbi:hypothetical protein GGF31_006056 [Allomyces arbusculus]|nr:hypothetical protein GGF31_006056 [Allomyces arbusculus]